MAAPAAERPDLYERGLAKLREIDGAGGERVIGSLDDIAPDCARLLIEFSFGDIDARPRLDLKSREIGVVAALTPLGNARPRPKVHLHGALNAWRRCTCVGCRSGIERGSALGSREIGIAESVFARGGAGADAVPPGPRAVRPPSRPAPARCPPAR